MFADDLWQSETILTPTILTPTILTPTEVNLTSLEEIRSIGCSMVVKTYIHLELARYITYHVFNEVIYSSRGDRIAYSNALLASSAECCKFEPW